MHLPHPATPRRCLHTCTHAHHCHCLLTHLRPPTCMHPTRSHRTCTHTCTLAPALALAHGTGTRTCMLLPPLARRHHSSSCTRHACTHSCMPALASAPSNTCTLHKAAPHCSPLWYPPHHLKLHPTTQICTPLALAPGGTHAIPRPLGGRITGEGGDGDLLGGGKATGW